MNTELLAAIDLLGMLVLDPLTGLPIALLALAAVWDFRTGRIPNALVFGGALLGFLCNALLPSHPGAALAAALGGLAAGLALMLPFYLMRAMGAGDVKLMAMTGAFLGFPGVLWAALATFIAGGVMALAWLGWHRGPRGAAHEIVAMLYRLTAGLGITRPHPRNESSAGTLPYGVAIAVGTVGYLVLRQLGLLG